MKSLRDLFRRKEEALPRPGPRQQDESILDILTSTSKHLSATNDLTSRLEIFASAVATLSKIKGCLIAAYAEDGSLLGHGCEGITLSKSGNSHSFTNQTLSDLESSGRWTELTADHSFPVETDINTRLLTRTLLDHEKKLGFILVEQNTLDIPSPVRSLEVLVQCFSWMIRDSIKLNSTLRLEALRQLELDGLGLSGAIQTSEVAARLKDIFNADAATILWREQEKLYLSATTDSRILEESIVYEPGVGLTGHVLATAEAIILDDARDTEEIRSKLGDRLAKSRGDEARHPEVLANSGDSFRFLAVPMHTLQKPQAADDAEPSKEDIPTLGVIRLLRESKAPPFTQEEKKDLQHFADLLGLAMRSAWRLVLGDEISKAETEAICITRNDLDKDSNGQAVPRMVHCGAGAEILFGKKAEELRGQDVRELYGEGEYEKVREALNKTLEQGKSVCGPIKLKVKRSSLKGEEVRFAEISYRLLENTFVIPPARYAVSVIRDTTEKQHLVELLDSKGLAYFRADRKGRTVETSGAECQLTGYSAEEMDGKLREDIYLQPSDRGRVMTQVRHADGDFAHVRERLKRKDSESWFWAEGVVRLVKDKEDNEAGTEGLYEDVTDRMRLQGFLDVEAGKLLKSHELYSKLEENAKFQLLFMTSLSHQLRSPLSALIGHLTNFRDGIVDSSRFSKRLEYCVGQARVCGQLVTNLTYMDRILRGDPFKLEHVNLTRMAIETSLDFESLAAKNKIRFRVDGNTIDKLKNIRGHDGLLRQVFINLYDNAIKYSKPRSIIRVRTVDTVGATYLQISNEGLRIPREERERIFRQGVRLPKAKAWVSDGSGLGLWLVRKILDAHDAEIHCTKIHEDGRDRTAFRLSFPVGPSRRP